MCNLNDAGSDNWRLSKMTKPDVLVMATNTANLVPWLEAEYSLHRYDLSEDPDALLDEVGERITAVVTTGAKGFSEAQLDKLPRVGIVASSGVGYDPIDIEACSSRGVVVTNTPDVLTDDVADLAIGLMIATRRNMIFGDAYVRSGDWGRLGMMGLTSSLKGKRLGIVGLGRIGSAIVRRAEPMGLEIGYCTRTRRDNAYRYESDVEALAAWSDILIVAIPGARETQHMIDRAVIDAVGPDGTLMMGGRLLQPSGSSIAASSTSSDSFFTLPSVCCSMLELQQKLSTVLLVNRVKPWPTGVKSAGGSVSASGSGS